MRARLATWLAAAFSRLAPDVCSRMPANGERSIYLTFDDGPTAEGTPELLDVLCEHGVPATFFLVGRNALEHPEHVRALTAAGHLIGNHTFAHLDAWREPRQRYLADLTRAQRVLENLTGLPVNHVRPPYGRMTRGLVRWCRRRRQRLLLWDVMPGDFERSATIGGVARSIERRVRPGSIICLHDSAQARPVTAAALRLCLPRLLNAGWTFRVPCEVSPERVTGHRERCADCAQRRSVANG